MICYAIPWFVESVIFVFLYVATSFEVLLLHPYPFMELNLRKYFLDVVKTLNYKTNSLKYIYIYVVKHLKTSSRGTIKH